MKSEDQTKALATYLHRKYCYASHIDQCGWQYELDDWSGYAHAHWFHEAKELVSLLKIFGLDFKDQ